MRIAQSIFLVIFISLGWSAESARAQTDQELSAEISFWETVRDSNHAAELQAYLDAFPEGRFKALATLRLNALKGGPTPPAPQTDEPGPPTTKAEPTNIAANRLLTHCLSATDQARRGPFGGVSDPALALRLCDAASISNATAKQFEIHESKALIHLSAQDYEAALHAATEIMVDLPARGQGITCLAEWFLGRSDHERYCADAATAGDIFGVYGTLLQAATKAPSNLPQLITNAIAATSDAGARQDVERTIGLLLEDRLLSPDALPQDVLARLQSATFEELLTGLGNSDQTLPIDLRIRAVLLARNDDDQGRSDAAFLLEQAAAQGDRKAMMALGQSALEDAGSISSIPGELREDVKARSTIGAAWLQRLVAVGPHQGAYYELFSHFYGVGTQRDITRASDHISLIRGPEMSQMRTTAEDIVSETLADPNAPANIVYLQLALARLGYDPGPADGVLGAKSKTAYAEFAADQGIADQPLQIGNAVASLFEKEKWQDAVKRNLELDGDLPGYQATVPDPLNFGWDAAYAF